MFSGIPIFHVLITKIDLLNPRPFSIFLAWNTYSEYIYYFSSNLKFTSFAFLEHTGLSLHSRSTLVVPFFFNKWLKISEEGTMNIFCYYSKCLFLHFLLLIVKKKHIVRSPKQSFKRDFLHQYIFVLIKGG